MKKIADGVVLSCLREGDQPELQRTAHGGFFALHDLLHYSVETTLGFDEGFFGLMASGWSFDNFTRHDDPRYRELPPQGPMVEHLVGILSLYLGDSACDDAELLELLTEDINRDLAAVNANCAAALPILVVDDIAAIRRKFAELTRHWDEVPVGGHLELPFPPVEAA